jgi:hypothetical protein
MNSLQMLATADDGYGYYFTGLLGLVIVFVSIVWIAFPFLVNAKFNELIREVKTLRGEMQKKGAVEAANVQRSTSNVQRPMEEKKEESTVYRID